MKSIARVLIPSLAALALAAAAFGEPVTLHVRDLQPIASALAALDGAEKLVGEKVVVVPYEFSGPTRWAIGSAHATIQRELAVYTRARDGLVRQVTGGRTRIEATDEAALVSYADQLQALLDTEVQLDLRLIPISDLALEKNAIPGSVLSALVPLIQP